MSEHSASRTGHSYGATAIDWRVVNATTNSPISFEVAPFAHDFGTNIDHRAEIVARQTAIGLLQLETTNERPSYFSDAPLGRAEKMFRRVTNGLDKTLVDYGIPDLPVKAARERLACPSRRVRCCQCSPRWTSRLISHVAPSATSEPSSSRKTNPTRRSVLSFRVNGETIKRFVSGQALAALEDHQIRDVFRGRRILAFGKLKVSGPRCVA
ncbi:hypothetical protein [Bradyrhizobium sp. 2S1]|uniref:hypothetical protein n=1 Tax=Bradyrhizobium sp. 2S1 TaxID=1404429 RepID=UPI00140B85DD|nr:hypothetical protein [Bradyrhizobium sp. 2S1]MCK7665622.1 hypothetical protein [Bradyrhizobium sp. 2S1]